MSQPTPNRNERELERLEAISALERGMDDPATPAVSPVPPTAEPKWCPDCNGEGVWCSMDHTGYEHENPCVKCNATGFLSAPPVAPVGTQE
jgi:hypothetical protein